jgi:hypothetical protein
VRTSSRDSPSRSPSARTTSKSPACTTTASALRWSSCTVRVHEGGLRRRRSTGAAGQPAGSRLRRPWLRCYDVLGPHGPLDPVPGRHRRTGAAREADRALSPHRALDGWADRAAARRPEPHGGGRDGEHRGQRGGGGLLPQPPDRQPPPRRPARVPGRLRRPGQRLALLLQQPVRGELAAQGPGGRSEADLRFDGRPLRRACRTRSGRTQ